MASSPASLVCLPPELWPMVFGNLRKPHDLMHLWTECRQVSRQFRDQVEQVFCSKHLPKTVVSFHLGLYYYGGDMFEGEKVVLDGVSFNLNRLEHDGRTAVYAIDECAEEYMPEILRRLDAAIPSHSRPRIDQPKYQVILRREANDTELPGLSLNRQAREISFDWRGMYMQFFAEEKQFHYHMKHWVKTVGDIEVRKARERIDNGESTMIDTMLEQTMVVTRALDESRKLARRSRIRRQWKAHDGTKVDMLDDGWFEDYGEKGALGRLKSARFGASWVDFSDDEEEAEKELSDDRMRDGTGEEEDACSNEDEEEEEEEEEGDEAVNAEAGGLKLGPSDHAQFNDCPPDCPEKWRLSGQSALNSGFNRALRDINCLFVRFRHNVPAY